LNKITACVAAITALIAAPAFAADMPVKAPPVAPAPVPTWTGFYGGIQFGGGWSDEAVTYLGNDIVSTAVLTGNVGNQPVTGNRTTQRGPVGGFEAGYNWQWSTWVLGLETDFSFVGMSGRASSTSLFDPATTQTTTAEQSTDWYGTVRGRAGWLATPNLLLFGTGGFAYGRVAESANYALSGATIFPKFVFSTPPGPLFSFSCPAPGAPCFAGSSSAIRTGWTAGGGVEWLLDQHWSAKIEYQFVDLGTETIRMTTKPCPSTICTLGGVPPFSTSPSSMNAAFHDRFNVVRLGLNYRF
jgi:outer membrane immunogenic protein